MSSMAERIKQDDPGVRRMKMTKASAGSFGKSSEEVDVRRISAEEEQEMILGGLEGMVAGAGSTGFGKFVQDTVSKASLQSHGYVDNNGMPHSNPSSEVTGVAAFLASRQAGDGREDHNYTEQQKVTVPTQGFGAGEGVETNMEEDRREPGNDGGLMSTSELMEKIQELIPKEERFRIPPEKNNLPPEKNKKPETARNRRRADDSTPDGTAWQSEVVDATSPRDRDLPDIPEALPEKYVPEKGDGSHPLPNESFEDWGTPPVPGVDQNYPEDPAKLTNIMGSLTRIRLTDGRVLVGKVLAENDMKLHFLGRVAGDRVDSSFDLWKRDILGPREAVRQDRQAREITNLENAYELYNRTREAKDPKTDYRVEKAIVTPADGVDRSVEKATNTRGAGQMSTLRLATDDLYQRLVDAGIQTDNHESDLYVENTPEALQIINLYQQEINNFTNITSFKDSEGKSWLDVPFAYTPFWANKTTADIMREASRKRAAQLPIQDEATGAVRQDAEEMMERNPGMDPEVILRIMQDNNPDLSEQELRDIMDSVRMGNKRKVAADLGLCQECGKAPAINTFMADNGDDVNYCYDCAEYLGAQVKPQIGAHTAADDAKDKKITPATAPKDNVATNDTMKDDTFYGDDKALHDQLDKHEKRASFLKKEATMKLKMADNYEKAGNIKMAKEMDKEGTTLYNEWSKVTATIAGMKKKATELRKITAGAKAPKLFFENRETEDKDNPLA